MLASVFEDLLVWGPRSTDTAPSNGVKPPFLQTTNEGPPQILVTEKARHLLRPSTLIGDCMRRIAQRGNDILRCDVELFSYASVIPAIGNQANDFFHRYAGAGDDRAAETHLGFHADALLKVGLWC